MNKQRILTFCLALLMVLGVVGALPQVAHADKQTIVMGGGVECTYDDVARTIVFEKVDPTDTGIMSREHFELESYPNDNYKKGLPYIFGLGYTPSNHSCYWNDSTTKDIIMTVKKGVKAPSDASLLFYNFNGTIKILEPEFIHSGVTNMSSIFGSWYLNTSNPTKKIELDLSRWDTSNVEKMNSWTGGIFQNGKVNSTKPMEKYAMDALYKLDYSSIKEFYLSHPICHYPVIDVRKIKLGDYDKMPHSPDFRKMTTDEFWLDGIPGKDDKVKSSFQPPEFKEAYVVDTLADDGKTVVKREYYPKGLVTKKLSYDGKYHMFIGTEDQYPQPKDGETIVTPTDINGGNTPVIPTPGVNDKTETVTVHKLFMTKDQLDNWSHEKALEEGYDATEGSLKLDEIFNATNHGVTEKAGIYFVWKYVGETKEVNGKQWNKGEYIYSDGDRTTDDFNKAIGGLTTETGIKFDVTKFIPGEYEIIEVPEKSTYPNPITGSKAVPVKISLPVYNEAGVVKDAHVYPKNTDNDLAIDKDFQEGTGGSEGAKPGEPRATKRDVPLSATIGEEIPYEVKTAITSGAQYSHMQWTDTMSKGLTFVPGSFEADLDGTTLEKDKHYELTSTHSGYIVKLMDDGITKIKEIKENGVITFKYNAILNSYAEVDKTEENDVILEYGKNEPQVEITTDIPTTTEDKTITVKKAWEGVEAEDIIIDLYEEISGKWKLIESQTIAENASPAQCTFNLKAGKDYRIVERANGFVHEHSLVVDDEFTITNKPLENKTIKPTVPLVITHGKKFVKTNFEGTERLFNAQFVIQKDGEGTQAGKQVYLALKSDEQLAGDITDYQAKQKAYLAAVKVLEDELNKPEDQQAEIAEKKKAVNDAKEERDEAFEAMHFHYYWTEDKEDTNIIVFVSDEEGRFEVVGLKELADDGKYRLIETKAPKGYSTLTDAVEFQVKKGSYQSDSTEMQYNPDDDDPANQGGYGKPVPNKKTTIPQTGGIGTIIFTVVGLSIMAVAIMSLRRRRVEEN